MIVIIFITGVKLIIREYKKFHIREKEPFQCIFFAKIIQDIIKHGGGINHRCTSSQCETYMREIYRGCVLAVGVCILAFRRK